MEEGKVKERTCLVKDPENLLSHLALCCNYHYFHYSSREASKNLEIKIQLEGEKPLPDVQSSLSSGERFSKQSVLFPLPTKRDKVPYSPTRMCQNVIMSSL